jgi:hypothetical protein
MPTGDEDHQQCTASSMIDDLKPFRPERNEAHRIERGLAVTQPAALDQHQPLRFRSRLAQRQYHSATRASCRKRACGISRRGRARR